MSTELERFFCAPLDTDALPCPYDRTHATSPARLHLVSIPAGTGIAGSAVLSCIKQHRKDSQTPHRLISLGLILFLSLLMSLCASPGACAQNLWLTEEGAETLTDEKRSFPSDSSTATAAYRLEDTGRPAETGTGSPLPYGPYSNGTPRHKDFLRAALEITGFLGVATAWYWSDPDQFATDFDFGADLDSLKARFITGTAWRLDDNEWSMNFNHIPAGAGFYLLARSNDLSIPESMLLTTATSFLWEAFVEIREVISINDSIMTPFGGWPIGEVTYQMGEFFQHSSPTLVNRFLGTTFGLSAAFNRWLDGTQPQAPRNVGRFGFTTDVWHRFRFLAAYGESSVDQNDTARDEANLGADFELVLDEKYGKPGEQCYFYKDGFLNELAFKVALADGGMVDTQFLARAAFLGHYQQNIVQDADNSGSLQGYSRFLGIGTAFEFYGQEFPGYEEEERLAVCDLIGPTVLLDYYWGGFHIRSLTDLYPTFSMVRPFAGEAWRAIYGRKIKSKRSFRWEDYYYSFGLSAGTRLETTYKPFELDAEVRYHLFDSIEGLDHRQNTVENDFNLHDERVSLKAGLTCHLPVDNLKVLFEAERLLRWSRIWTFGEDLQETRFLLGLSYEL